MIGDSQVLISDMLGAVPHELLQEWHVTGSCNAKTRTPDDLSWYARVTKQKSFLVGLISLCIK